jgi:hypothetical protein
MRPCWRQPRGLLREEGGRSPFRFYRVSWGEVVANDCVTRVTARVRDYSVGCLRQSTKAPLGEAQLKFTTSVFTVSHHAAPKCTPAWVIRHLALGAQSRASTLEFRE